MTERPSEVTRAVYLLWICLPISIVHTLLAWGYITANRPAATIAYVLFFNWVLDAFLFWRIGEGSNWARITLLIKALLVLFPFYVSVRLTFAYSIPLAGLSVLQFVLEAAALYSLFAYPGSEWFGEEPQSSVIPQ
jgi:hypothetical protein